MDREKVEKIKQAVRRNFDSSPDPYRSFEDKHGFFRTLTKTLLDAVSVRPGGLILDVGCGTGASCAEILGALPERRVWGLDLSPAMLDAARALVPESAKMKYVQGDAARLTEHFDFSFDLILYSASVFLIPDYQESLRQAVRLLRSEGWVGLSFMDGLYNPVGENLLALADKEAQEGLNLKKPVKWAEFKSFFQETLTRNRCWNEDFQLSHDLMRDFFSIPAMSAGLFPQHDYPERVRKVNRLFQYVPAKPLLFRWQLMVGQRG